MPTVQPQILASPADGAARECDAPEQEDARLGHRDASSLWTRLADQVARRVHANPLLGLVRERRSVLRALEHPNESGESSSAEAERILYFTLMSAIDAGLIRTMEDALKVLRHASQPLGPMGAEWLARQARAMKWEDR